MREWGGQNSVNFKDNMAYAVTGVRKALRDNPQIVAFLNAPGPDGRRPGDDPAWIKLAAQFGRAQADLMGVPALSQAYTPREQRRSAPGSVAAAKKEIAQIMKDSPPGSPGYSDSDVQERLTELFRISAGTGSIVGRGNRNA